MKRFEYAIALKKSKEGGFVVTCRDLPQLITQGDDRDDALEAAVDAMDEAFSAYIIGKIKFSTPSKARRGEHLIAPPPETVAKAALYVLLLENTSQRE